MLPAPWSGCSGFRNDRSCRAESRRSSRSWKKGGRVCVTAPSRSQWRPWPRTFGKLQQRRRRKPIRSHERAARRWASPWACDGAAACSRNLPAIEWSHGDSIWMRTGYRQHARWAESGEHRFVETDSVQVIERHAAGAPAQEHAGRARARQHFARLARRRWRCWPALSAAIRRAFAGAPPGNDQPCWIELQEVEPAKGPTAIESDDVRIDILGRYVDLIATSLDPMIGAFRQRGEGCRDAQIRTAR